MSVKGRKTKTDLRAIDPRAPPKREPNRKRWYCVRTWHRLHVRASSEILAVSKSLGEPILVSMPMAHRVERKGKWEHQVEDGLLFPPYIFIAARLGTPDLAGSIANCRHVVRIMCDPEGRPVAIPWREMRKIRRRSTKKAPKKYASQYREGERVHVTEGAFAGFDGIFEKPVKERVRILLSIFGGQTPVEIDEKDLRPAVGRAA